MQNDKNSLNKHRQELKKEYLRGMTDAKNVQKESNDNFLYTLKRKMGEMVEDDEFTKLEIATKIEGLIELIDDYMEGEVTSTEAAAENPVDHFEEHLHDIQDSIEGDGDDIISISDFVRKDF